MINLTVQKSTIQQTIFILFIIFSLTSCKVLNRGVTYGEMLDAVPQDDKELLTNHDYMRCDNGRKSFGDIILKCNMWGRKKIKRGAPELCTYQKDNLYAWTWEMPNSARGVIAYPALQVGRSPWGFAEDINHAGFPIKVDEISVLDVSYKVESYVKNRKYNLAFDFWLTQKEFDDHNGIVTEIMIWEDYFDFSSYGKVKETITTPFGEYKVYEGHLKNDAFKQDWVYIAFVRTSPRTEGSVDIKYLLNYLTEKKQIDSNTYFTSIEFGNEIGNSSGYSIVRKFDWTLE